jgi:hypothetical protein
VNPNNPKAAGEGARLEREVNRLTTERGALFDKAGAKFGLSDADQERLSTIERALDECFLARRQMRAGLDAQRFDREQPFFRTRQARTPTTR